MKMDATERSIFSEKGDLVSNRIAFAELNEKVALKHKVLLDRINVVHKQMILEEVCRDIIKTHEIILGLIKHDNIDK